MAIAKYKQKVNNTNMIKTAMRGKHTLLKNEVQCYIFNAQSVLLYKSGKGFSLVSGEIKNGESPQQAAARLIYEKSGLVANSLQLEGEALVIQSGPLEDIQHRIFVISCSDFSGKAGPGTAWINRDNVKEHVDKCALLILPLVLAGKKFRAKFVIDSSCEMLNYKLDEL